MIWNLGPAGCGGGGWGGGGSGGGQNFITGLMKRIQFCILNGNEKESSSQIYNYRIISP